MTKIAKSLAMIALVAAIAVGATSSFFSDKETSVGNTFTAGTIDISVDGQNPWNTSWSNYLDKPCQTNYMTFTIKNEGENPANLWKRLYDVETDGGVSTYCGVASSEPEYTEGGGIITYDANNEPVCNNNDYTERHNLAAYMIYDMAICDPAGNATGNCPFVDDGYGNNAKPAIGQGSWVVLIDENEETRIDNVNDVWISLGELEKDKKLIVVQSYHLMAWSDAGEETITNWAQGDVMTFNIELEARQLSADAPQNPGAGTLVMENKNCSTWDYITGDAIGGTLTHNLSGSTFDYTFTGTVKTSEEYTLLYVGPSDDYPCVGSVVIGTHTFTANTVATFTGNTDLGVDINNGKIWLIPSDSYNSGLMTGWPCANILFEMAGVTYDDIDV